MSEKEINNTIGKNISHYMQSKNKSQEDFANYMGVSQATISNWCTGTKLPRMNKIDKICEFFNITRTELMTEPIASDKPQRQNGKGEIFANDESEYHALIDNIMEGEDEFAKNIFKTFAKFDVEEWRALRHMIEKYKAASNECSNDDDDMTLIADINAIPDTPEELEKQFPPVEINRNDDAGWFKHPAIPLYFRLSSHDNPCFSVKV